MEKLRSFTKREMGTVDDDKGEDGKIPCTMKRHHEMVREFIQRLNTSVKEVVLRLTSLEVRLSIDMDDCW